MRIGFDFDNTIVSYDALFYRVAVEQSLVPLETPMTKLAVRDYLRKSGNENAWTEMQGYVYGARMNDAIAYSGVIDFMKLARSNGISMVIVSHKTKHPFLGPKYDLHGVAKTWINSVLVNGNESLFRPDEMFFEVTKEDKINRIDELNCNYFIDDLPEILSMPGFPKRTEGILFDPEDHHSSEGVNLRFKLWQDISDYLETRW